jgi:hypothetical protein
MQYIHALILAIFLIAISMTVFGLWLYQVTTRAVTASVYEMNYQRDVEAARRAEAGQGNNTG